MTTAIEPWVIATRVSTEEQASPGHVSLDTQEDACSRYVGQQGGMTAEVVKHVGSGLQAAPFYSAIEAALERTGAKRVVVWRFDRLGREHVEAMLVCRDLAKQGVEVRSATEPTESTFMRDLLFLLANEESRRISTRVVPGMAEQVRRGYWVTSAPFGARTVPVADAAGNRLGTTLAWNDDAWAVQEIFRMVAGGATEAVTMNFVRTHGLRSSRNRGKTLSRTSVRHMLENPAYIGEVAWNREGRGKFRDKGKRGRSEVITANGLHEALIDAETWNAVQKRLGERRTYKCNRKQSHFLLDGLVYCGQCASHMRGHAHTIKGRYYRGYYCSGRRDRYSCTQSYLSAERVEEQVKGFILDAIFPPSSAQVDFVGFLQRFRDRREQAGASTQKMRERLTRRRSELAEQRYRVIDMELAGRITPHESDRKRNEIYDDIAAIDSDLERLPADQGTPGPMIDRIAELAEQLRDACSGASAGISSLADQRPVLLNRFGMELNTDQWKALARILVRRVELVGNLKDGQVILQWTETAKALLHEEDEVSKLSQTGHRLPGTSKAARRALLPDSGPKARVASPWPPKQHRRNGPMRVSPHNRVGTTKDRSKR